VPDRSVQAKDGEGRKMPDGLSALVARILEQLAVTAWLPAAMLIGVGSLLVQLHTNKSLDIPRAVQDLATKPWGVIIILLFELVLTTMVTQAFSFASIRVLEGYWTPNRVVEPFLRRRVTRRVGLWKRLEARVQSLDQELFESARVRLLKEEDRNHVDVWEAQVYRIPKAQRRQQDKAVILAANTIDWRQKADPATAATFYRAQARLDDFPPGDSSPSSTTNSSSTPPHLRLGTAEAEQLACSLALGPSELHQVDHHVALGVLHVISEPIRLPTV
jgi:hypothetical protein